MSGFRTLRTLLREAVGTYNAGQWVPGARSTTTTLASVQPVTMGRDMRALPEGRRLSDFVKLYTYDRLKVTEECAGVQPDILIHDGFGYELVSVEANQSGLLNHYKYIAVKIFKFTSVADWTSGVTQRS